MVKSKERRRMERRENWQKGVLKCQDTPCKPVLTELDKKMSSKIAMWILSAIASFVVVVVGGAQWILVEKTSDIHHVQIEQNKRLERIENRIWR